MVIINVVRAALALVLGLLNTIFWFILAVLTPLLTETRPNWPAKGWAWVAHWFIYRLVLGVKLKVEFNGSPVAPNEVFVVFGNHPPTPALSEWVYAVMSAFPKYHFSPVARSTHRMARGFSGIGGLIIPREDGDEAVAELRRRVEHLPPRTVLTIFSDENRFTPKRHKAAWDEVRRKRRLHLYGQHFLTLPMRGRGTHTIASVQPQASYVRCTVTFDRQAHLVWDAWRLPGSTLLVRFDRVPALPTDQAECFRVLNQHAAEMDQIMVQHQQK